MGEGGTGCGWVRPCLTIEERTSCELAARKAGLTLSEWMRGAMVYALDHVSRGVVEEFVAKADVAGRDLNASARAANAAARRYGRAWKMEEDDVSRMLRLLETCRALAESAGGACPPPPDETWDASRFVIVRTMFDVDEMHQPERPGVRVSETLERRIKEALPKGRGSLSLWVRCALSVALQRDEEQGEWVATTDLEFQLLMRARTRWTTNASQALRSIKKVREAQAGSRFLDMEEHLSVVAACVAAREAVDGAYGRFDHACSELVKSLGIG